MISYLKYINNTTTLTAITVILATTLVVEGIFAARTTPYAAFAYKNGGNGNGNTITPQINKQYGIVSGFDNSFDQELKPDMYSSKPTLYTRGICNTNITNSNTEELA